MKGIMVDSNPYLVPAAIEEEDVVRADAARGASVVWLAAAVAAVSLAGSILVMSKLYGIGDFTTVFVMALLPSSGLTIPGVAIYSLVRYLFRRQLQYTSTPTSLMAAGAMLALVMVPIYSFGSIASSELLAWGVSLLCALIACYPICKAECWMATRYPQHSPFVFQVERGANVLWFSAGCFLFGFVVGALMQTPDLMSVVAGGVITAALLCLLGTAGYAIATGLLPRTSPATIGSRIFASLIFSIAIYLFGLAMDVFEVAPGLSRLVILVPSSLLAALVDRSISRLATRS